VQVQVQVQVMPRVMHLRRKPPLRPNQLERVTDRLERLLMPSYSRTSCKILPAAH